MCRAKKVERQKSVIFLAAGGLNGDVLQKGNVHHSNIGISLPNMKGSVEISICSCKETGVEERK